MCRDDSAEDACLFSVCDLFDYRGKCPNTKRVGRRTRWKLGGFRLGKKETWTNGPMSELH